MNELSSKPTILWATGRAACGKSTFIRIATEECRNVSLDIVSLCDEGLLFQILDEDTDHVHHDHPFGDARFRLKSNYPFDEGIRRISTQLREMIDHPPSKPVVALIELARGKVTDILNVSFQRAISLLDPVVITNSHFVYLQSALNEQLERNRIRQQDGQPHPPDAVMESLYGSDDFDVASQHIPFEIIQNSGDMPSFEGAIRRSVQTAISPAVIAKRLATPVVDVSI
jgi:hypothetical protein